MLIKGSVKVIKTASDYYKINKKVIIVASKITPDIVVVMHYVLAIITEIDNKLCHAAIVAREYNKPLVMGVVKATKKYRDGQTLSINTVTKKIC